MIVNKKRRFEGDKTLTLLLSVYLSLLPIEAILTIGRLGSFHKLLGIVLIVYCLFKNGLRIQLKNLTSIVFASLALLSILWSISMSTTISYSTTILTVVVLNLILEQTTFTIDEYNFIKNSIIIVGVILAINVAFRTGLTVVEVGRTTIGFNDNNRVDYNNLALGLSFSSILLLCEINSKRILKNVFCVFGCLIITYAIILTGSRGGLLCFLIAGVVLFLYYLRSSHFLVKLFIILVTILIIINFNKLIELAPADMVTRFTIADIQRNGGSGRYTIWIKGLSYYISRTGLTQKIVGIGYGAYPHMMSSSFGFYIAAHNDYIQTLLELGIIGLVSLLVLFGDEIKKSINSKCIVSLVIMILVITGAFSMETVFKKVTWGALLIAYIARTTTQNRDSRYFKKNRSRNDENSICNFPSDGKRIERRTNNRN